MLSKVLDKTFLALCGLALFIRLFLEPTLNNSGAFARENISVLANSLVLFVISFLFILKKTVLKENIRCPKVFWPLGLFCLIASLSIFYSVDTPSSLRFILDLWSSFFFMIVLVNLLDSIKSIEIVVGVLITLAVIAGAEAAYNYLVILPQILAHKINGVPYTDRGIQQLLNTHRTPTLFGWPNILAGFLVMTIPLMAAFLVPNRRLIIKILAGIAIVIALYALYITLTISSWGGILVGVTASFLLIKRISLDYQGKIWFFSIASLMIILIAFFFSQKMNLPHGNSLNARWQYFTSACCLIKLHPILGSGWRSYGIANVPFIKNINGRSDFVHNSYLQIWAEIGIFGLMAFLSFLWLLGKDSIKLFDERHHQNCWLAGAIVAGIVGCMVDNLFSYTMIKPQVALFWWVLCALAISLKENLITRTPALKNQMLFKKIFLVLTIVGGIMTVRLTLAEFYFFTAVDNIHRDMQYEQAELLCRKAHGLNPWDKKFDLARAFALYGSFAQSHDIHTLLLAREAALLSEGQISLGSEREAILKNINDALLASHLR